MTAAKQPHRDHYCYVLFRETGVPFYVGKGRGDRWLVHEKECKPGRSYKDNIIASMRARGLEIPKIKVAEGLTQAAAVETERALIAALGNHPVGILANRTAGGDGMSDPTGEISARISRTLTGRKTGPPSAETRQKISAAHRGQKRARQSDETQAKRAASVAKAWARGTHVNAGMKGKRHRPETIAKMRASGIARVTDELRERMRAIGRGTYGER